MEMYLMYLLPIFTFTPLDEHNVIYLRKAQFFLKRTQIKSMFCNSIYFHTLQLLCDIRIHMGFIEYNAHCHMKVCHLTYFRYMCTIVYKYIYIC